MSTFNQSRSYVRTCFLDRTTDCTAKAHAGRRAYGGLAQALRVPTASPHLIDTSPPPSPSGSRRTDKLFGTNIPSQLSSPLLKAERC